MRWKIAGKVEVVGIFSEIKEAKIRSLGEGLGGVNKKLELI